MKIGPSFGSEAAAAGLTGKPFTVDLNTGAITDGGLSKADLAALQAVIAAHDPSRPAPGSAPTTCTKLGLKRAFSEMGIWPQVRAMIEASPDLQEEWDLATELKTTDPIVQGAIVGLGQILGAPPSPDQVAKIIGRANALVA